MYSNKISSRRDMVLSGLALSLVSLPVTAQTDDESVEEVVVLGSTLILT